MFQTDPITTQLIQFLRRLRQIGPGQPPFEEVGISPAQLALIECVAVRPGCSLQQLADELALTPPTVSVGVRKLEDLELLTRQPNPEDARAWQFELTATGTALWERVQRCRQEKAARLLAGLTPEEQQTLLALLERALVAAEIAATSPDAAVD